MTDYKLVPVEPTPEMVQAACVEEQRPLPMWSRMKAIYKAMLTAAPAVQGEPTDDELLDWAGEEQFFLFCDKDEFLQIARAVMHRYMGRQTAVQGEPVALPPFATKIIEKLRRFDVCAEDGQGADIGRHWLDMLVQLGLLNRVQRSPALWEMAQQGEDVLEGYTAPQPAPGVAGLVEALERIARHPRTRGDELGYAGCRNIAKEALAAHRKGD